MQPTQQEEQPEERMNKQQAEDAVLRAAHAYAVSKGFRIAPNAGNDIAAMARHAVEHLSPPAVFPFDAQLNRTALSKADDAFRRLIDEMIAARATIKDYEVTHPDSIGEETLHFARLRLCPLFPIC